jgi:tetratricopeptide (TPR) repeat protein
MKYFYEFFAFFLLSAIVVTTFPAISKSNKFANKYDKNIQENKKISQMVYGTGIPSRKMAAEGERLLSVSPDFKTALQNYNANNYTQAIEYSNRAIAKWPQSSPVYVLRSLCFYRLNQDRLALADLNTAIEIEPTHPFPYLYRGYIYGRNGSFSLARNEFSITANLAIKDKNTKVYNFAQEAFASTPSSAPVFTPYPTMEFPIVAPNVPYNPSSAITP